LVLPTIACSYKLNDFFFDKLSWTYVCLHTWYFPVQKPDSNRLWA